MRYSIVTACVLAGLALPLGGLAHAGPRGPGAEPPREGMHRVVADRADGARQQRLNRVGQRILAAAAPWCGGAPERCRPSLVIEEGSGLNAHAQTDRVSVSRAMIDLSRNDDELALVVAHELSHLILGHPERSAMSLNEVARAEEREADRLGLRLLARAGFHPRRAIELWPSLAAAQPKLLAGGPMHPALAERYATLRVLCGEIQGGRC